MPTEDATRFRLGSLTLPYARWPLDRALQGIAGAGFRHVGLLARAGGESVLPESPTPEDYRALRRKVEGYGLTPELMFARQPQGDPAESLRRDVDAVADLGMPYLLHIPVSPAPGFPRESKERVGQMAWLARVENWFRMIVPAVRRAERRGVTILIKPHGGIAGTGEDLALIVERVASPALRVVYDPGNVVYYEGVRPEGDVANVADLCRALIIKDHRGGRAELDFPTPGDGDIDHVAIFRSLLAAGFSGPVLIERIDGLQSPEDADRELARGRTYLERAVAEAIG